MCRDCTLRSTDRELTDSLSPCPDPVAFTVFWVMVPLCLSWIFYHTIQATPRVLVLKHMLAGMAAVHLISTG